MSVHCLGLCLYLSKSFFNFLFRDKALGDVLLKWREEESEQWNLLPEQACRSNATWIQGSICDDSFLMEGPVEFLHSEHIAEFAVLVGLSTIEFSTINHGRAVQPI